MKHSDTSEVLLSTEERNNSTLLPTDEGNNDRKSEVSVINVHAIDAERQQDQNHENNDTEKTRECETQNQNILLPSVYNKLISEKYVKQFGGVSSSPRISQNGSPGRLIPIAIPSNEDGSEEVVVEDVRNLDINIEITCDDSHQKSENDHKNTNIRQIDKISDIHETISSYNSNELIRPNDDIHIDIDTNRKSTGNKSTGNKSTGNKSTGNKSTGNITIYHRLSIIRARCKMIRNSIGKLLFSIFFWCFPGNYQRENQKGDIKVHYTDMSATEQKKFREFILDLGFALIYYGAQSYRVEYHLTLIGTKYGMEAYYCLMPTGLFMNVGSIHDTQNDMIVNFVKTKSGGTNLAKLCKLDDLSKELIHGTCTLQEARTKLSDVMKTTGANFCQRLLSILMYSLTGGVMSVFFNGNLMDIAASFFAGLITGIVVLISSKIEPLSKMLRIFSSFISVLIALGFKYLVEIINHQFLNSFELPQVNELLVALAGNVVLLPGLTITIAFIEIATNSILMGGARFIQGCIMIFQITFGIVVGYRIGLFIDFKYESTILNTPYPPWIYACILPLAAFGFIMVLQAPKYPLSVIFILLASYSSYFTSFYVSMYMGREVGSFAGALSFTMISNVYNRITKHPSIVVNTCAIIYLLPGIASIRTVYSLMLNNVQESLSALYMLFMTPSTITMGFILSYYLIPPKQKLSIS